MWAHVEEEKQLKQLQHQQQKRNTTDEVPFKGEEHGRRPRRPSGQAEDGARGGAADSGNTKHMSAREKLFLLQNKAFTEQEANPKRRDVASACNEEVSKGSTGNMSLAFQDGDVRACFDIDGFLCKKRSKEVRAMYHI